ncbi:putative Rho GTPase activation protein [Helianthus annuus]|uniref:Rho GTPase activation protein n=1 Tax=Helianthus annuus TaxID=4232 RepID=A0A251VFX8_HELAN|nr:putative Rho GTPase activation protein [Helianthus annuus]KAJ0604888.1 putative Rho GTPase activation protein [Helianthus annuus]KAJ0618905.1 putative Rho GTPase activation protein [Helianthus annuus]
MMPNSKSNMVDSKNNNNHELKHSNSIITKNNSNNNSEDDSKTHAHASAQGDGGGGTLSPHGAAQPSEADYCLNGNKVHKSGPLFLSSKGIGWTSWKKRWFVLTQTSLVFYRSDPNAAPQKGCEANLTLGGIDLNSSGSVVVKADKKLLTVSFPDSRDGRAFTLKAETTDDLNEWKAALDEALANAPSASPKAGPTGTSKNDKGDTADAASSEQSKDGAPGKPMILGRPILLALEDVDGTPSFLEKALRYVEDYGVKVEGILRQAADVEDVERRMREYEQGKVEFNEDEDAHVIGDCIKYILRELPSSPVPASCCNALLDAHKTDRATRVSAMRAAICDTFPEPNRRLLQRILIMMEAVADNKNVNRMSVSAVAACMAPLLLRPILACECNLDSQFSMGGDQSDQLMQAAAAANHAQAIVITLLEEYDNIFGEGDMLSDLYSDSEDLGSESEELSEDDYDDGDYTSEDSEHASTSSHSGGDGDGYQKNTKRPTTLRSHTIAHREVIKKSKSKPKSHARSISEVPDNVSNQIGDNITRKTVEHGTRPENENAQQSTNRELSDDIQRSSTTADSRGNTKHATQQTDVTPDATKEESQAKNEEADLLSEKKELETRRIQLKQEVARLEQQLQKELELRKRLETGIKISQQALFSQFSTNEKAESYVISEATNTSQESKDGNNKHQVHSYSTRLPPHKQLDLTRSSKETSSSKNMRRSSTKKPKRLNSKNEGMRT